MPKRFKVMLGVLVILAVVVVGGWSAWKVTDSNADTNDIRRILHSQEMISDRTECRALIRSRFDEVIAQRDAIGWSAIPPLINFHSGADVDLAALAESLEEANDAVLALPPVDEAVRDGYELNGVEYPPCPKAPS